MITELNLTPGRKEFEWVSNITSGNASAGIDIKEAIPDYRYGIKSITISIADEKWVELLDGTDVIFGPVILKEYTPLTVTFESPIYCTTGNALVLKTQEAFGVFAIIKGMTEPPIPSKPFNPSPENNATEVATDATLSWESVYQSVGYKVYFGTSSNPPLVSTQDELTYSPTMDAGTVYYWRIDEYLGGDSAQGDLWSFTTE